MVSHKIQFLAMILLITEAYSLQCPCCPQQCGTTCAPATGSIIPGGQFIVPAVIKPCIPACQPSTCSQYCYPYNKQAYISCADDDYDCELDKLLYLLICNIIENKKCCGKKCSSCVCECSSACDACSCDSCACGCTCADEDECGYCTSVCCCPGKDCVCCCPGKDCVCCCPGKDCVCCCPGKDCVCCCPGKDCVCTIPSCDNTCPEICVYLKPAPCCQQ